MIRTAGGPVAVVGHGGVDGLAHDGLRLESVVERLVGGHVDGDREVDQGDAGRDDGELTEADPPADPPVLLRHHGLLLLPTAHPHLPTADLTISPYTPS